MSNVISMSNCLWVYCPCLTTHVSCLMSKDACQREKSTHCVSRVNARRSLIVYRLIVRSTSQCLSSTMVVSRLTSFNRLSSHLALLAITQAHGLPPITSHYYLNNPLLLNINWTFQTAFLINKHTIFIHLYHNKTLFPLLFSLFLVICWTFPFYGKHLCFLHCY